MQEMVLKQEKQLAEMTATVNDLAITLYRRDNFKKEIDRWESVIEGIRRTLLEWVSELRQVAEKWIVTGHILNEIDDLQQRNEERIGQLLTISNAIKKNLQEKAIDDENIDAITNFIADCSVAIDTIVEISIGKIDRNC